MPDTRCERCQRPDEGPDTRCYQMPDDREQMPDNRCKRDMEGEILRRTGSKLVNLNIDHKNLSGINAELLAKATTELDNLNIWDTSL